MIALLLAVLGTPVAPGPPVLPAPTTVEEGCAPEQLRPMLSAPRARLSELQTELDRRFAATLAEERLHEAVSQGHAAGRSGAFGAAAALALVGLAAIGFAVGRRSGGRGYPIALATAGVVFVLAGAGVAVRHTDRERRDLGRALTLGACRTRLLETRATLEHSRLAQCVHDLEEVDEDLLGWQARLRGGGTISIADVAHIHEEIRSTKR